MRIGDAGEAAGGGDLDPVGEDFHSDVIAHHAVRTVDNGVDQAFEPGLSWDLWYRSKASVVAQSLPLGNPRLDHFCRVLDLGRQGASEAEVGSFFEGHRRSDTALGAVVSQHSDVGAGELALGMGVEKKCCRDPELSPTVDQVARVQHVFDR